MNLVANALISKIIEPLKVIAPSSNEFRIAFVNSRAKFNGVKCDALQVNDTRADISEHLNLSLIKCRGIVKLMTEMVSDEKIKYDFALFTIVIPGNDVKNSSVNMKLYSDKEVRLNANILKQNNHVQKSQKSV